MGREVGEESEVGREVGGEESEVEREVGGGGE